MATPGNPVPPTPEPSKSEAIVPQQSSLAPVPINSPTRTLLALVLTQAPVLGGMLTAIFNGATASWVATHPVTAILVFVGYEFVVLTKGVFAKVWLNLEPDVVRNLTDGVRGLMGAIRARALYAVSGYRRAYLERIVLEHRALNVRGLRTQGAFSIQLEHAFVELRIAPNTAQLSNLLNPTGAKELSGSRPIWDFIRHLQAEKGQALALAIVGAPGSGKTTLLQHVALVFAKNRQRRYGVDSLLPIFIALREHVAALISDSPPTLGGLAQAIFAQKLREPSPPAWFEKQLHEGTCLVLFDGLDEVAREEDRVRVSAWVDHQIFSYAKSIFVLTARPRGYSSAPLRRANVLEIMPFGNRQVQQFVQKWYLANETMRAGGQEDKGVRLEAEKQATDLLRRLRLRPALDSLTSNPLLLTMLVTVHSQRNAIPGKRVELYNEICEVLLGHWQSAKGLTQTFSVGQLRSVFEPLATHMMREGVRELRTAEVLAVIETPLAEIGVSENTVKQFLPMLQAESGLFVEREHDAWGFVHLSIQEYLASSFMRKQSARFEWQAMIGNSWWHETLRLYAAQGDATSLIAACLESDTILSLALASEFLDEAQRLEPTLRAEAEQRFVAGLESTDAERRRLAADVRLARRLHNLRRIDDGCEIDLGYVTCAEYQLFVDEMRASGFLVQPDHWHLGQFDKGKSGEPVLGVRFEDARAFVEWLTVRHMGDALYRLPTLDEVANNPPSSAELVTAWCTRDGRPMLYGIDKVEHLIKEVLGAWSNLEISSPFVYTPDLFFAAHAARVEFVSGHGGKLADVKSARMPREIISALEKAHERARDQFVKIAERVGNAHAHAVARSFSYGGTFSREWVRSRISTLNHALACALDRRFEPELSSELDLSSEDMSAINDVLNSSGTADDFPRYLAIMLAALTGLRTVSNLPSHRAACCLYLACLAEYAFVERRVGYRFGMTARNGTSVSSALLSLHWWGHLAAARLRGSLRAWEGIRIVRERLEFGSREQGVPMVVESPALQMHTWQILVLYGVRVGSGVQFWGPFVYPRPGTS